MKEAIVFAVFLLLSVALWPIVTKWYMEYFFDYEVYRATDFVLASLAVGAAVNFLIFMMGIGFSETGNKRRRR